MFLSLIKTFTTMLLIVSSLSIIKGQDRKITSKNHPGCDVCTDDDTLIYTRAEGSHDTIHQIWDFTRGTPTVILAVSNINTTMDIQWMGNTPRSFNFSEEPKYCFATTIDTIYEYNDVHDKGYIDNTSDRRAVHLIHSSWRLVDDVRTEDEVMVTMRGRFSQGHISGELDVKLDLVPYKDYAVDLPHLIHTANSSLMDVTLVNATTTPSFNSSRFAARLVLVSTGRENDTFRYTMRKSLDDEHTPGVFEIVEVKSPQSWSSGSGGFLQFRPVAYTQRQRGVTSSTVVRVSQFNRTEIRSSTLDSFFREYTRQELIIQDVLISFGETGDGFYTKHNYTSWSTSIGYGSPPMEGFSIFVVSVLCVGLGVPALVSGGAGVYALARRPSRRD